MQQQQQDCPLERKAAPPPPHQDTMAGGVSGRITDLTVGALFLVSVSTLLLIGLLLFSSGGGGGLLWSAADIGDEMRLRPAPSSSLAADTEPPMLQNSGEVGVAHCALPVRGQKPACQVDVMRNPLSPPLASFSARPLLCSFVHPVQGVVGGIEVILYAWLHFFPATGTLLAHPPTGEGDGTVGDSGTRGTAATVKGFALLPSSKLLWEQPAGADENCPTFCRKRPNSGEGVAWGGRGRGDAHTKGWGVKAWQQGRELPHILQEEVQLRWWQGLKGGEGGGTSSTGAFHPDDVSIPSLGLCHSPS